MARKKRDTAKEQFWSDAIQRRQQSGLTIREFCRREGLTESTYQFWRRELKKRGSNGQSVIVQENSSEDNAAFAAVTINTNEILNDSAIEILMGNECRIRVPRGFDRQSLVDVLAVLESR